MDLLSHILNTDEELIIITDHHVKERVLKQLSKQKVFKSMLFLNAKDLVDKVFFTYQSHALETAMNYVPLKAEILEERLKWLYVIDETIQYPSTRLQSLVELKQVLIDADAINHQTHVEALFAKKRVLVKLRKTSPITEAALARLRTITDVHIIEDTPHEDNLIEFGAFERSDDEIAYVATRIRSLIQQGMDLTSIKLVLNSDNDQHSTETIFDMFGIPLSFNQSAPLIHYEFVRNFMDALDASPHQKLYDRFEDALHTIQDKSLSRDIRLEVKLIQTINPFVLRIESYETIRPLIIHTLEHTKLKQPSMKHAVQVVTFDQLTPEEDQLVFILGCVEGNFPNFVSENDYLNIEEKTILDIETANETNERLKRQLTGLISALPHVVFTYALHGLKDSYQVSGYLNNLLPQMKAHPIEPYALDDHAYAEAYDQLRTKTLLDNYLDYGDDSPSLKHLYETFKDRYTPHHNQFGPLQVETIERLLKRPLSLSFTKLNTFFKCQFRYLLAHVLHLEDTSETLSRDLGTFFHRVLECFHDQNTIEDDDLETILQEVLEKEQRHYGASEMFFLRNSFASIKQALKNITIQHEQSAYTIAKTEGFYQKKYDHLDAVLNGVIDKILIREEQGINHIVLIDYKTGKPTLTLKEGLFGMNIQLVYYVLLLKAHFKDTPHDFTGFYEQCLMQKPPKEQEDKTLDDVLFDQLKLQGYTVNNIEEAFYFDRLLDSRPMIQGMRLTTQQAFYKQVKSYTPSELNRLIEHLDALIEEAILAIQLGQFTINPKSDLKNKDLSCAYCSFKDVCFKSPEDYRQLNIPDNDEALFECLEKAGEHDE